MMELLAQVAIKVIMITFFPLAIQADDIMGARSTLLAIQVKVRRNHISV
jgi:hypothetical protein